MMTEWALAMHLWHYIPTRSHAHGVCILVWYLMLCIPCRAQPDSVTVSKLHQDVVALDEISQRCDERGRELGSLLDFTAKFPHQYGLAELRAFQQQLEALSDCHKSTKEAFSKLMAQLPEEGHPDRSSQATPQVQMLSDLRQRRQAVQRRLVRLAALTEHAGKQLEALAKNLVPADSSGQQRQ